MSKPIILKGLDGANPLAFFAALGVLKLLDDAAPSNEQQTSRMEWAKNGKWYPAVYGKSSIDDIAEAIMNEKLFWENDPAFLLSYLKSGQTASPNTKGAIRDLKPPPKTMKKYLENIAKIAAEESLTSANMAASFGSEMVVDGKGNTKPTAFHFTAGNQTFLKMVCELLAGLTIENIIEALKGPWQRKSKLPSFSWDATSARIYALRASDPSKEKRGSTPGAEWLALMGLTFFPVMPEGKKLLTTAVKGGWKNSNFSWPIWNVPATADSVRSLVSMKDLTSLNFAERQAYGICEIYSSRINRSDQGGYGSFSPSKII